MTFQNDLDYAKQLAVLRDAFVSGEMGEYDYIKRIDYGDSCVFQYIIQGHALPTMIQTVFRINKYEFDGVSGFDTWNGYYTFYHHTDAVRMWISETSEWLPSTEFDCSDGFHFQQSLVYSEQTVREMLTFAYLLENPLPPPFKYMRMNMKYYFEMQSILNKIREGKQ